MSDELIGQLDALNSRRSRNKIKCKVVNRFRIKGRIDKHYAVGCTFRITGGIEPFRLTVVTVNWGRGYDVGEFKKAVMDVLNKVGEKEYVVLLIQELDEADPGPEHVVLAGLMEPGTTFVRWETREPIAVSPGVHVSRKRKRMIMDQGTKIGAPKGTGPRRFFVSCVVTIQGVKIGVGNQHPHRNLAHPKVQKARAEGRAIVRAEIRDLVEICDLVIHGGDVNGLNYPKSHPREKVGNEKRYDIIRYIDKLES